MSLSGFLPHWSLGERHLVLSGSYWLHASAPGYQDLQETIVIGDAEDQTLSFALEKLPGEVTVLTEAPAEGAEVLLDGQMAGETPLVLQVAAGKHELAIRHPRYQPYQTEVEVAGMGQAQTVTASLEPAWADVSVSSAPEGAEILVNGEATGQQTPAVVEVVAGKREISLKRPGYKLWRTEVQVVAQQEMALPEAALALADGRLQVATAPPGAYLTIGGDYRGQTPATVALAPDAEHELLVTLAGYQPIRQRVAVQAEEETALALTLEPLLGQVKLRVSPAEARLLVDGEAAGTGSQTLRLTARKHRLRIELEGHEAFEADITPQPDLVQELTVALLTLEAAKAAAIPQEISTATGEKLRLVRPGRLTLGSPRREPGRRSNEALRAAELTRPFYAGVTEVSNGAFKAFDAGHDSGTHGRALLTREERPVVNISWNQAVEFCNWLSEQEGLPPAYERVQGSWRLAQPVNQGYRLLTEAEWAWVARYAAGPAPSRFPWGDAMPPPAGTGNFADESAAMMVPYHIVGYDDGFRGPAPPGAFAANPLGLYDLAGNVSEWVHDHYAIEDRTEAATDPLGPETGEYHVIRGSNYTHGRFSELRWTFRDYGAEPRPDVGFRIARYLE